jgi:hypothetical protein
MKKLFNHKISIINIKKQLDSNGYILIDSLINEKVLQNISKELRLWNFNFNSNKIGPVINKHSYFFSNALCSSISLFDLITNSQILNICKSTLGKNFRLKAHRVYNLQKHYKFPWHTDNKSVDKKNSSKGIVFIIYLDDVTSGENQVIKGTHLTSHNYEQNTLDDHYINRKYKKDIVSLKAKKGSVIIFDQSIIHRGKPIQGKESRNAVFFQVDTNINDAENLIINTSFINDRVLKNCKQYLGFDKKASFPTSPDNTSFETIPPKILISIILKVPFFIINFYIAFIKSRMPRRFKNIIKSILK